MALPKPMVGAPASATGAVQRAPIGTPVPTDATTEVSAEYVGLGLVNAEGISMNPDRSTEDVREWGGQIVRTIQSEYGLTITFTLIESTRAETLKSIYGDENVTVDETGGKVAIVHNEALPGEAVFVISMKDGTVLRRIAVPNGQLILTGEVPYVRNGIIEYQVTLTAYPDESGNNAYEYIDKPVDAPAGA